jgi:hypothetical protein
MVAFALSFSSSSSRRRNRVAWLHVARRVGRGTKAPLSRRPGASCGPPMGVRGGHHGWWPHAGPVGCEGSKREMVLAQVPERCLPRIHGLYLTPTHPPPYILSLPPTFPPPYRACLPPFLLLRPVISACLLQPHALFHPMV